MRETSGKRKASLFFAPEFLSVDVRGIENQNFREMDFTAIDFETANASRASVCSAGLVRVEGGKVVKKIHTLINPCSPFNMYNTAVHGITSFDVRDAPRFDEFFAEMREYLSGYVVAHNAAFDIGCLRAELERFSIGAPHFEYLCTLCLSRRTLKTLPSHKLDVVAKYYGLGDFLHHNALADAETCAKIFEIFCERIDVLQFKKTFDTPRPKPLRPADRNSFQRPTGGNLRAASFAFSREKGMPVPVSKNQGAAAQPPDPPKQASLFDEADISAQTRRHDFDFDYSPVDFSKNFVLAGEFESGRGALESFILYSGGRVFRAPDAFTDYVVVGGARVQAQLTEIDRIVDNAMRIARAAFISEKHFFAQAK